MKTKFFLPSPKIDFFLKSYFSIVLIPLIGVYVSLQGLYLSGKDYWRGGVGDGPLVFFIYGFYTSLVSYSIFIILSFLFILFFNNKLMSGRKINKKTKFGLFMLSLVFYVLTLLIISFAMSLF